MGASWAASWGAPPHPVLVQVEDETSWRNLSSPGARLNPERHAQVTVRNSRDRGREKLRRGQEAWWCEQQGGAARANPEKQE